jgi:hypothetical protein
VALGLGVVSESVSVKSNLAFLNGNLMVPAGHPPYFHSYGEVMRAPKLNANEIVMLELFTITAFAANVISAWAFAKAALPVDTRVAVSIQMRNARPEVSREIGDSRGAC